MYVLLRWRVGGLYIDSDEEDDRIKDKKADSEPARKSSRANKGKIFNCNMQWLNVKLYRTLGQNKRLERPDEVVAIPQVKVMMLSSWAWKVSLFIQFQIYF